ncbi:MAG: hypothetical protein ACSLFP_12390 [Acidimicrobiales bacterium]
MRRVFLFAALLSLVGLSTAFAASLTTQSEDVASFGSDVSISVPTTQPPPAVQAFFLRGDSDSPPGLLSPTPLQSNVETRLIKKDSQTVQAQADATKYFVWRTDTVVGAPLVVGGTTRLTIEQKAQAGSRLTAGLFSCPASAAISSTAATGCIQIGPSAVGTVPGNGFDEVTVSFGNVPTSSIPVGNQLRLKIVNRDKDDAGVVVSTKDFDVAWGYNPARKARLEFGL